MSRGVTAHSLVSGFDSKNEVMSETITTSPIGLPGGPPKRLGEALVDNGLITAAQLNEALDLQKTWGSKLGDIVLARGWVRAFPFFQTLARHLDRPFVNLIETPGDAQLIEDSLIDEYGGRLYLP